jgi:NADPH-dependent 2,4-dienoyl-CoA reductase/sulfur reductase-like enzyme
MLDAARVVLSDRFQTIVARVAWQFMVVLVGSGERFRNLTSSDVTRREGKLCEVPIEPALLTRTGLNHLVVVGAGIVGLVTAWFLQEYGAAFTVVDRERIVAGASWGNAGWLSPGIVTPLAEPSVLRPTHARSPTWNANLREFALRSSRHESGSSPVRPVPLT